MKIFFRFAFASGMFFVLLTITLLPSWSVAAADRNSSPSVPSAPVMARQLRAMAQITFTPVATIYLPYVSRNGTTSAPTVTPDPTSDPTSDPTPDPTSNPTGEPGPADVKIIHIEYNPDGNDDVGEYVDIKNFGGAVVMTDWTLQDETDKTFTFPSFTLNADATVRVWTGSGSDDESNLYWGRSAVWNNSNGDTATLRNGASDVVDQCAYPGGAPGFVDCLSQ